jgi:hypothetical protein
MMSTFRLFCIAFIPAAALVLLPGHMAARQGHLIENPIRNIPVWVRKEFTARHFDAEYKIIYRLYPYAITGDFNGDGRKDVAIQVQNLTTGKTGIAVFHGRKPQVIVTQVTILGAGRNVGAAGDNFTWADVWVRIKGREAGESSHSKKPADAMSLSNKDGKSVQIRWNGESYGASRR